MKKGILISLLSLFCLNINAQNSWEIKEVRNNSVYGEVTLMTIPMGDINVNPIGFRGGVTHTFEIEKQGLFADVSAELGFQQGRADFKMKEIPHRLSQKILDGRLPLNVGYKFPIGEDFALRIYAGGNVQYYLLTKETWHDYKENKEYDVEYINKKFHFGYQVGVNFDFTEEWYAGFEFTHTLSAISDDERNGATRATPEISNIDCYDSHPYAFQFRVGYRF
jgi:hypothetical protein